MPSPCLRTRPSTDRSDSEARRTVQREPGRGYEAYSVDLLPPEIGLEIVARRFDPEVIVVNAGGVWWHDWTRALVTAAPSDVPLVLYIRDPKAVELLAEPDIHADLVLANADYHARSLAKLGVSALVIPSVVEPELYRTETTGEAVVFINPVVSKGVETAFAMAEMAPDVLFHFREAWHLPEHITAQLTERAAQLRNVEFFMSTDNRMEPYRRARLLLAPYEDFGRPRVVMEAQISGIPVVARDDPALREAVGPGGSSSRPMRPSTCGSVPSERSGTTLRSTSVTPRPRASTVSAKRSTPTR